MDDYGNRTHEERPIKVLVDALNALGARIEYMEKEGYPPFAYFSEASFQAERSRYREMLALNIYPLS